MFSDKYMSTNIDEHTYLSYLACQRSEVQADLINRKNNTKCDNISYILWSLFSEYGEQIEHF